MASPGRERESIRFSAMLCPLPTLEYTNMSSVSEPWKLAIKQFLRMWLAISTNESADGKGKQLFVWWQSPVSQQVAPITSECIRLSTRWAQVRRDWIYTLAYVKDQLRCWFKVFKTIFSGVRKALRTLINTIRAAFEHQNGPSNTTFYHGLEAERRTWEKVKRLHYLGIFMTIFDKSGQCSPSRILVKIRRRKPISSWEKSVQILAFGMWGITNQVPRRGALCCPAPASGTDHRQQQSPATDCGSYLKRRCVVLVDT